MATRAQSRDFAKGTLAAMDRNAERVTSFIQIDHASHVDDSLLVKGVKHGLAVSGVVNPATTRITLVSEDMQTLQTALVQSEKARDYWHEQFDKVQRQLDELMLTSEKPPVAEERWITMDEAALELECHYSTVWRAHRDGRLKTKVIGGGTKKDHYLCDPGTYVPSAYMTKKSQKSQ